jgi:Flp pilus assembly protein TadB
MSKESSSSGVSFMGLLTILFIALKLTNFIDWSWWWVLSPMWLSAVILVLAMLLLVLIRKTKERL